MSETLLILAMAIGFGFYTDINKPKQYELDLENGKSEQIIVDKKSEYACPRYCAIDHYHIAQMCDEDCSHSHGDNRVHTLSKSNQQIEFNGQIVLAMERVSKIKVLPGGKANQSYKKK